MAMNDMHKAWEKAMTQWWDTVLESPAFTETMGQGLAGHEKVRKAYEEQVDKNLQAMHLPTRKDLVRVAKICSLLEDRLLALEDRLLELEDSRAEAERAALEARIAAAEAQLEHNERLSSIEARLDALLAQAPKKAPAAKKAPARKPAAKKPAATRSKKKS